MSLRIAQSHWSLRFGHLYDSFKSCLTSYYELFTEKSIRGHSLSFCAEKLCFNTNICLFWRWLTDAGPGQRYGLEPYQAWNPSNQYTWPSSKRSPYLPQASDTAQSPTRPAGDMAQNPTRPVFRPTNIHCLEPNEPRIYYGQATRPRTIPGLKFVQ
ncbi:hypothetical protein MAR_006958 [Mya arenaria]|uniref:Uncharacterized protein n=1 Tax=Mya arenaria TaxID=6604 RepID=A0ABY7DCK6_MYAAR|nr:hypothetical protein MAR_006958 [Mya arenaria]